MLRWVRNTIGFTYDAANRIVSENQPVTTSSAITTSFGYDAATSTFSTAYDADGRPVPKSCSCGVQGDRCGTEGSIGHEYARVSRESQ